MEKLQKRFIGVAALVAVFFFSTVAGRAANWNPLPDTGQTTCYNAEGNEITCPAEGEPFYGQDAQYQGVAPSYTDNGNATVTDNNTRLIWQQNTADINGDGIITSDDYPTGDFTPWQEAIDYCDGLTYAGASDWRLPDSNELISIVDYSRTEPAINPIFQSKSNAYWTVTPFLMNPTHALIVHFYLGSRSISLKTSTIWVRCVRGGV